MARTLVLGYEGVYGLADMVRAIWYYRRLAQEHVFDLYLDLRGHPIGAFYETRRPPVDARPQRLGPEGLGPLFEDPSRDFCVYTCSNQYPNQVPEALRDLRAYLRPNPLLLDRVYLLMNSRDLRKDRFVSLHVRCGDKFLPETRERDMDFYATTPVQENLRQLLARREREFSGLPIVLHSDNVEIRDKLAAQYGFETLPVDPVHVGFHTGDEAKLLDSVAEFHVIGMARKVFAFQTDSVIHPGSLRTSGYPMWSAKLHGTDFEAI